MEDTTTPNTMVEPLKVLAGDCDFQKIMTPTALLRRMQELAYAHARSQNFDAASICSGNYYWVLARVTFKLSDELPPWDHDWELNTAITGYDKALAYRDFECNYQGRTFGLGASSWILVDSVERTITPPSTIFACRDEVPSFFAGTFRATRIKPAPDYTWSTPYEVGYRDVDLHDHVNNTRYMAYFLDRYTREHFETWRVQECTINFLHELVWGDVIQTGSQEARVDSDEDHTQRRLHAVRRADGTICALGDITWTRRR